MESKYHHGVLRYSIWIFREPSSGGSEYLQNPSETRDSQPLLRTLAHWRCACNWKECRPSRNGRCVQRNRRTRGTAVLSLSAANSQWDCLFPNGPTLRWDRVESAIWVSIRAYPAESTPSSSSDGGFQSRRWRFLGPYFPTPGVNVCCNKVAAFVRLIGTTSRFLCL